MVRKTLCTVLIICSFFFSMTSTLAQESDYRSGLFFREDWKEIPAEIPLNQKHVSNTDLSKVEEIGFTDLMPGGKSVACSRLDWIKVYGIYVNRKRDH